MTLPTTQTSLTVKQLYDRESCTYSYLLIDPSTREAAIIDPVRELFERDMQLINELGLELLYTIETHAHADHVTSSGKIRQNTGARIVFGEASGIPAIDIAIKDGESLPLGHFSIRAIATPGHTSACTSFFADGRLFTGDTLLIRGCGRTDFQEGDPATLYDSITKKLFTLSDETIVYPGHDYNGQTSSTIGEEKKWNPRLGNSRSKESFVDLMNNLNLDMPKKINEAVPANISVGINYDPKRYLQHEFTMNDLHQVWQKLPENCLIMDNRTPEEFAKGHVPGSLNIPLGSENDNIGKINTYDKVYIYCRSGRRAQTTFTNLSFQGMEHLYCVSHSGMPDWIKAGYEVES
ncbi:MAG: MBL fold metallo-hydrolase [Gammaproteobacteria bacterium]|nr:MBL fold metallo-hydrolase [Gammaproteobacteria bacterium]